MNKPSSTLTGAGASVPTMSPVEREKASVLIVEPDSDSRTRLRQTLLSIGYSGIADAPNHLAALKKLEERHVSHLIFNAKKTNMPPQEFLSKVFEFDEDIIAVASSAAPNLDDVFGLLVIGARGYLVEPYNSQSVEEALAMATKGEPISNAILNAKNRNEALASLMMSTLANVSTVMRQARQFETAQRDVSKKLFAFRRAADVARLFSDGGDSALLESIIGLCVERSQGPATRLGRIRKRLGKKKSSKSEQPKAVEADAENQQAAAGERKEA